ncbi:hypothetical protein CHL67_08340 [Prosthecochloris sp. GSB1]|uniref:radical SAM protein n=1 Tax=Prosthecochloris sp. GSB1 TaxID=281093 RepID=UPI000B8CBEAC|nr:radical SAM protein [Prosthecochloris sp. GSB1]ASQ90924.1 hypothetical protein CHL67_08340 [Prosthecochloris sp. GSB1]
MTTDISQKITESVCALKDPIAIYEIGSGEDVAIYNRANQKKIFSTRKRANALLDEFQTELSDKPSVSNVASKTYRVEVTFSCNARCDYCLVYNNAIKQLDESMSLEMAKEIVSSFNESMADEGSVLVIGGEPFLNMPVIEHIVDFLKGQITIFSNGTLIDEDLASWLSRPNIRTIISLDGLSEHNFGRKNLFGQPIFKDSLRGYDFLRKNNAKTGIGCLASAANVDCLYDIVQYYHTEYGEKSFGISIPHYTSINNHPVDVKVYTAQMKKIFRYAYINGIYIDQIASILRPLVFESFRACACKIVSGQRTFYPDGSETLCTKLDTKESEFSSFLEQPFSFSPLFTDQCQSCRSISICGGGCIWDAHFDSSHHDQRNCYFNREMLLVILSHMHDYLPKHKVVSKKELLRVYSSMIGEEA